MRRALSLLFVTAFVATACGDDGGGAADAAPLRSIEGVTVEVADGRGHVEADLDYPDSPPSGGDHFPVWQNCGFYDAPVLDETAVHALEHGVVWLAYSPDLSSGDLDVVRDHFDAADGRALASPHPDVDVLEVVAWEHRLVVDDVNDERIGEFIELARSGAHSPEPGASCSGGVDEASPSGAP